MVVEEVVDGGASREVLDALDALNREVHLLRLQQARDNATISYLRSEVERLKANQDYLKALFESYDRRLAMLASAELTLPALEQPTQTRFGADPSSDSDGDGVPDASDRYMGYDDLLYRDVDGDGVPDALDSDTTRDTDMDKDGIDDAEDPSDDRPWLIKLLGWLGVA